jgi:hypothetical protein
MESLKGKDHLEDLRIDGRIILKWISGKYRWKVWIGSGRGPVMAFCEHGNESFGSIKGRKFLD